ncbi:MAG TPA: IS66 family transposase [Burkholderiales bacterium]|nr:IS66 family transposase [Burkholderiales bacterium]
MALELDRMDEDQVRTAAKLLERENERLLREVLELRQKLSAAQGNSVEQLTLLAELEQKLALRNKMLFGRSSEKRGSKSQPGDKAPQPGHGPREQVELGLIEREHDLDVADRVCTSCGEPLAEMTGQFEESEEVDVLERQFVLVRHKRKKYRCRCGGCIETALGPDKLIKGGRYSVDFAVSVAVAKYADHLPLERQVRVMKRQGLVVDSQTLWDQLNALAKWLGPTHELLHCYVLQQPVIGADETFWRLMESGENKRWQTWAACAPNAVSYRIRDSRSAQAAGEVLDGYVGTILCDGYSAYESLKKRGGGFQLAHCWAHVRRKFVEAEDVAPAPCKQVLDLIGELYAVERGCDTDADHARVRAERSRDVLRRIHAWALEQRALPQSPLGKAVRYMGDLWPGLIRFVEDPRLALDNNATERALRGVVVGRKNHYGSRSERGTEVAALFYSLIESAKLAGVEPDAYLRRAAHAAVRREPIQLPHELATA